MIIKSGRILKQKIKSDLKQYYEFIKHELELNKDNILETIATTSLYNTEDKEHKKDKIFETYESLNDKIDQIYEYNLLELDNLELVDCVRRDRSYEVEYIKKTAFSKFCIFLKYEDMSKKMCDLLQQNLFGVLIVFDSYLNENQLNYIK